MVGSPTHRNPHTLRERYSSVSDEDTVVKRSRDCPDHRVGSDPAPLVSHLGCVGLSKEGDLTLPISKAYLSGDGHI